MAPHPNKAHLAPAIKAVPSALASFQRYPLAYTIAYQKHVSIGVPPNNVLQRTLENVAKLPIVSCVARVALPNAGFAECR